MCAPEGSIHLPGPQLACHVTAASTGATLTQLSHLSAQATQTHAPRAPTAATPHPLGLMPARIVLPALAASGHRAARRVQSALQASTSTLRTAASRVAKGHTQGLARIHALPAPADGTGCRQVRPPWRPARSAQLARSAPGLGRAAWPAGARSVTAASGRQRVPPAATTAPLAGSRPRQAASPVAVGCTKTRRSHLDASLALQDGTTPSWGSAQREAAGGAAPGASQARQCCRTLFPWGSPPALTAWSGGTVERPSAATVNCALLACMQMSAHR